MTSVSVVGVVPVSEDCNVDVVGSIYLQRDPSHTHVRYVIHVVEGDRHRDERQVMDGGRFGSLLGPSSE